MLAEGVRRADPWRRSLIHFVISCLPPGPGSGICAACSGIVTRCSFWGLCTTLIDVCSFWFSWETDEKNAVEVTEDPGRRF